MNDSRDRENIERKMAAMRSTLGADVREFASEARTLFDWRNHFRAHPWIYCGTAAALGFLLVPSPKRPVKLEAAVLPGEDGTRTLLIEPGRLGARQSDGLAGSIFRLAMTALARESIGYLKDHIRGHYAAKSPLAGDSGPTTS